MAESDGVRLGDSDDDRFLNQILDNISSVNEEPIKMQEDESVSGSNNHSLNPDETNSVVSEISPESLSE